MRSKNILVSFLTIVSVLCLAVVVSAQDYSIDAVRIDGVDITASKASMVAGESATVKVYFTSSVTDSDVKVKVSIEGEKADSDSRSETFNVESGQSYRKALSIKAPNDLKDDLSDDITLTVEIDGKNSKVEKEYTLRVQRPTYNAAVKSVSISESVESGETFPVDFVLKNMGYNDLEDLYITASIPALGVEKTSYFGDIVALECDEDDSTLENYGVNITRKCNEDDTDSVSGRLLLKVPYDAKAGIYTLEVKVTNDDTTNSVVKQIVINNDLANSVISTSSSKTVATGEDAVYNLLIVNPTSKLKVYRVITGSSDGISSNVDEAVVAIPAGSSKTVKVTANADTEGEYTFDVSVLSGEELVSTTALNLKVEGSSTSLKTTSPVAVLTVILAIVFLVLLIVLIVLIGKKPTKSEEFGESYY